MEKRIAYRDILVVFANYGFQKASMDDLARAAGVSRQTLYNRHKTKQAVFDWAVSGFVEEQTRRAFAHLRMPGSAVVDRLVSFYSEWMGQLAPLLHNTPHGAEMIDVGGESLQRAGIESHVDHQRAVAEFLVEAGLTSDPAEATELSFLLAMASKGLLFKFDNVEDFETGMRRIVRTALRSA